MNAVLVLVVCAFRPAHIDRANELKVVAKSLCFLALSKVRREQGYTFVSTRTFTPGLDCSFVFFEILVLFFTLRGDTLQQNRPIINYVRIQDQDRKGRRKQNGRHLQKIMHFLKSRVKKPLLHQGSNLGFIIVNILKHIYSRT